VLFRLSDLWSENPSAQGSNRLDNPRVHQFVTQWSHWLELECSKDCDMDLLVMDAILALAEALKTFSGDDRVLTTQVNTKCKAVLSSEHACALDEIKTGLEATDMYYHVQKYLAECPQYPDSIHSAGFALEETKCAKTSKPCKKPGLLPGHFVCVILLMWPYMKTEGQTTHASLLSVFIKKQVKVAPGMLQNELSQLQYQLQVLLGRAPSLAGCGLEVCCSKTSCR